MSLQRLGAAGADGPLARTFQWDPKREGIRTFGWDEDDRLPGARFYLSDRGAGAGADEGSLALLRYIPGQRPTFRFRRRGGAGVIGKLVSKGRAARAHARLRDVHAAVGGADALFSLARPLELDEIRDGFFQEQLSGIPLPELVSADNLERWMGRVGAVHAQIHRLTVPSAPPWDRDTYLASLEERCEWAALAFPEHAGLLAAARHGLWQRRPQPDPKDLVFCHSAFGCGQPLADGDRILVVDFDDAEVSDRALEIARFLVLLKKRLALLAKDAGATGRGLLEQARGASLDGYRHNGGPLPDEKWLRWYRVAWEIDHLARSVTADDVRPGSVQASVGALEHAMRELGVPAGGEAS